MEEVDYYVIIKDHLFELFGFFFLIKNGDRIGSQDLIKLNVENLIMGKISTYYTSKSKKYLYISSCTELMKKLFSSYTVELNYFVQGNAKRPFEFDIFIPDLSLAFEYNGEYHYQSVPVYLI